MLRIIVEFLTKVSLRIEIKLVKLLQQEQGLILDEFSHIQRSFLLFRHKEPQGVSAQCKTGLFSASSLTQSLRSCRSAAASGRDTQTEKSSPPPGKGKEQTGEGRGVAVFP
jgi:hypothetical protein